ncbi:MAG TPA: DNA polymerase III subunit beta [Candidatus Paceibacterota bacterium]|nr:DNA polymerase III subunit beta [Candidatus Paceibacterota bacterium]
MKVECIKEKFEEAVAQASRFTGKNESLPVLECLYLETRENEILIRATNLDLGIEIKISAKVFAEGSVAVPGAVLRSLLSGMGNEKKIILETSRENLTVSSSKNTSLIKSHHTEDFPTIPKVSGNEVFSVSSAILRDGIGSVWYSASTSPVKPELSSVYVYKEESDLIFVATDSFRLAEKRVPMKSSVNFTSAMIPYRNIVEIMRIFENHSGEVSVNASKNQISFEMDGLYLTSRLIDGIFPDYRQIIPKEFVTEVVVLKADIIGAVKITNIFADKFSKVLFKVNTKEKRFEVEARNADIGENTTRVEAKISGEGLDIGFNYRYILDTLQVLKEDSVSMEFSGEGKALVMKGLGDNSFIYLVMPMNR